MTAKKTAVGRAASVAAAIVPIAAVVLTGCASQASRTTAAKAKPSTAGAHSSGPVSGSPSRSGATVAPSPTSTVVATLDYCHLVTSAQIRVATGHAPTEAASPVKGPSGAVEQCIWAVTFSSQSSQALILWGRSPEEFAFIVGRSHDLTPVVGMGDEAYVSPTVMSHGLPTTNVWVRVGQNCLNLVVPAGKAPSIALARNAISTLK